MAKQACNKVKNKFCGIYDQYYGKINYHKSNKFLFKDQLN